MAASSLPTRQATLLGNFSKLVDLLAAYPVARTRPFFDAAEKASPGSGGLYSVTVDPWKCTGCLECIEVCGPGALSAQAQDAASWQALLNETLSGFVADLPAWADELREVRAVIAQLGADMDAGMDGAPLSLEVIG